MDNRAMELTLARMAKEFLPYSIDERLLLPPDMRDCLPEGHGANSEVGGCLGLPDILCWLHLRGNGNRPVRRPDLTGG